VIYVKKKVENLKKINLNDLTLGRIGYNENKDNETNR
jgi:hypothetical protein